MEIKLIQIAQLISGSIEGDENCIISAVSKIEEGFVGSITFLANEKYSNFIYSTGASAVIVNSNFKADKPLNASLIRVEDAYTAFAKILNVFNPVRYDEIGISSSAIISPSAIVGKDVFIGNFVTLGSNVTIGETTKVYHNSVIGNDVKIGKNCKIFPNVVIMANSIIGDNCSLYSGVIIGADGFGFAPEKGGNYAKVPQVGNVVIEDNVEIGANTTVDRATIGSTIIRKGVKLDNLIQIAHNCEIGENTVIAAQVGISGSTKIGKNCMIGGQVGIAGHIKIGDNVILYAKTGVIGNIEDGAMHMGAPSFDVKRYKKNYIYYMNLEKFAQRITQLEHEIKDLKRERINFLSLF
ncbi:MAG: UDP-3-O-(3-hydroxymyristoyl)glucosamine N-acyltransferase [Bacteroidales bacterium]|nr:UDP-3-O-(3-hydroxymyristoyl)glucosamine N-acyltransferase [Bacteroidales bacterium]